MSRTLEAPATMVLTYRLRLQPTEPQRRALDGILEQQRQLYNAALEERIECYRKTGKTLNDVAQSRSLTVIRAEDPTFAGVQRRIQRATLVRLQRAFQAFFRRAKAGAGAQSGFPKFAGREHWHGFGFDAPLQIHFDGRRLSFAGMCGGVRVSKRDARRLPPITSETWKGVHFKRLRTGHGAPWQVTFQVATPIAAGRGGCGKGAVGVDWGTSVLAALSTGQIEDNPRPREVAAAALRRRERKVARAQRGSKRRMKARLRKQKVERAIANRRRNRLDKLSKALVTNYRTMRVAGNRRTEEVSSVARERRRGASRRLRTGRGRGKPGSLKLMLRRARMDTQCRSHIRRRFERHAENHCAPTRSSQEARPGTSARPCAGTRWRSCAPAARRRTRGSSPSRSRSRCCASSSPAPSPRPATGFPRPPAPRPCNDPASRHRHTCGEKGAVLHDHRPVRHLAQCAGPRRRAAFDPRRDRAPRDDPPRRLARVPHQHGERNRPMIARAK